MDLARHAVRRRFVPAPFAHRPRQLRLARARRLQCPPPRLPSTSSSSSLSTPPKRGACRPCLRVRPYLGNPARRPAATARRPARQRRRPGHQLGAVAPAELRRHGPEPGSASPQNRTRPQCRPGRASWLSSPGYPREPSPTMRTDRPHRTSQSLATSRWSRRSSRGRPQRRTPGSTTLERTVRSPTP